MNIGLAIFEFLMTLIYAGMIVAAAVLPAVLLWRTERKRLNDPDYWRKVGLVVKSIRAFDSVSEVIGQYMGAAIYASVVFKGIRYRYDRIAPPSYKRWLDSAELFLEPGIVYVAT